MTRSDRKSSGSPAAQANFANEPARPFQPLVASRHLLASRSIVRQPHPRPNRRRARHRPALPMAAGALACLLLAIAIASPTLEAGLQAGIPELVLQIKGADPMPPVVDPSEAGLMASFEGR